MPVIPSQSLFQPSQIISDSYETLLRQLYGLVINLPQYLNVNGLNVGFISFQDVINLLQTGQTERWIIDPMLQPWAGHPNSPNKIITLFGNNGMTYLVKARYDAITNQIFPPVYKKLKYLTIQ